MDNKTIYALSTVCGKSGVAVVRISGRRCRVGRTKNDEFAGRSEKTALRIFFRFASPCYTMKHSDHALVLYFKSAAFLYRRRCCRISDSWVACRCKFRFGRIGSLFFFSFG